MKILKNIKDILLKYKLWVILLNDSTIIFINFFALKFFFQFEIVNNIIFLLLFFYVSLFFLFSNHKNLNRYFNEKNILKISLTIFFSNLLFFIFNLSFFVINFSYFFQLFFMNLVMIIFSRYIIFYSLIKYHKDNNKNKILIYGIEANAYYLNNIIDSFEGYVCIGFICPKNKKKYNNLAGKNIIDLNTFKAKLKKNKIQVKGILNSSNTFNEDLEVINQLAYEYDIQIYDDISNFYEKVLKNDLNYIFPKLPIIEKELLKKVEYNKNQFLDKTVLITGAAGSIGKKLSLQILSLNPKKIIFLDHNEFGLYQLEKLVNSSINFKAEVFYELLNLSILENVKYLFNNYKIDYVYHSAAYKHVNIVENNKFSTFINNFLSTKYLVEECNKSEVSKFLLVSTDKSVYPSNFMGASKRLCELLLHQYFDNEKCNFYIVRFGNVINSSGSVLPMFDEQIKSGGPVTVTDKNTTRYFMSINQATSLIILASVMNYKSCYFILDMGKPYKIDDIAKKMISHYERVYETFYKKLNIKIDYIGLSKGEKLHETLSYEDELQKTDNNYILTTEEKLTEKIDFNELNNKFIKNTFNSKDFINYLKKISNDFKYLS